MHPLAIYLYSVSASDVDGEEQSSKALQQRVVHHDWMFARGGLALRVGNVVTRAVPAGVVAAGSPAA